MLLHFWSIYVLIVARSKNSYFFTSVYFIVSFVVNFILCFLAVANFTEIYVYNMLSFSFKTLNIFSFQLRKNDKYFTFYLYLESRCILYSINDILSLDVSYHFHFTTVFVWHTFRHRKCNTNLSLLLAHTT